MDGAHVIAEQGCDDVFKVLIDLPTGRRASRRVHVIIGGEPSTALVKTLDGVPYVDMDTEYQECLESLYFEGQYTRQNQIAAAHSDTNGWIWTHPSYMAWEQDESSILWIEGKPGSGKSVLAKQIQTSLAKDQETYTCQWFFSTRGGHTLVAHTSFMRSILYQLLQQNRSFFQYFLNTYRACAPRTSLPWESLRSMQEILRNIIATGIRIQCIVDAMDEAEAGEDVHSRQKLLITLSDLVALPETSRFKIIVCSRPIHDIDVAFSRHQRLFGSVHKIVLQAENSGTISSTIDVGLTSLRDAMRFWGDNYVPPQAPDLKGPYQQKRPPKGLSRPERLSPFQEKQKRREDSMFKKIRSYLLVNAQGVVLWVTLILGVLESTIRKGMYTFSELEQRLKTLPIGLDGLYKYCIDEIRSNSGPEVVAKARRALMFVSGGNALKPLKLEELWEALATPLDIESALLSNEDPIAEGRAHITSWKEFRWQLHAMCGPLVEVVTLNTRANRPAYDDVCGTDTVQLLHRTVKDFLGSYDLAGALSFSEAEAAQFTEDAPNAYAHIVMPSKSTRYISLGSDKTGNWASNIENVVEYLSDKKLLPWIFDTIPNHPMEKARLLGIFSFLLDDCTYPPLKSWSEAKIEREFGQHVMTSSGLETAQSIVCAHFVHYACSNGFTVAVRVLMEILALDRTDYIMYACFDAALMVAIRHEMLDLVQAFTVHGRNEPECRFWEESMYNVKGMSFYLTSFEMAAAQSGNEAIVREVYDRNHRKEKQMPWDQWWYLSRGRKNWSRSPDDFRVLLEFTRECRVARQALEPLPSENVREAIQAIIDYGMCWGET
ncbi:hypothetical protein BDV96DRAFT_648235 [Lophiotrema nucula]|uniref:Nephrocystin 3-like N-terminal domain-containing protein n=1 Tax=Lophiotrema nucula TaxID=690887 RepID=A0A6A5Z320_9PLEO|nr:hypothetical protein BDV96DRAFT_648235 [Lophiotrema nucula]